MGDLEKHLADYSKNRGYSAADQGVYAFVMRHVQPLGEKYQNEMYVKEPWIQGVILGLEGLDNIVVALRERKEEGIRKDLKLKVGESTCIWRHFPGTWSSLDKDLLLLSTVSEKVGNYLRAYTREAIDSVNAKNQHGIPLLQWRYTVAKETERSEIIPLSRFVDVADILDW